MTHLLKLHMLVQNWDKEILKPLNLLEMDILLIKIERNRFWKMIILTVDSNKIEEGLVLILSQLFLSNQKYLINHPRYLHLLHLNTLMYLNNQRFYFNKKIQLDHSSFVKTIVHYSIDSKWKQKSTNQHSTDLKY